MTPSLAAPGQGLCRGLFASVDGLKSRPDLNGRVVRVGAPKSDRWAIFDAIRGAHILVRPENLRAVVPPRELVDKALLADDTRSLIFEHLLPADLASAAGACASFRDQSCLTAARRGWERLPLTYETTIGGSWTEPTGGGAYGSNVGEIDLPVSVAPLPRAFSGTRRGFAVATHGACQIFSADGDAPYKVGWGLMDPDKPEDDHDGALPRPLFYCDSVTSLATSERLNSIFVAAPPDDGVRRIQMPEGLVVDETYAWDCHACAVGGDLLFYSHLDEEGDVYEDEGGVVLSVARADKLRRKVACLKLSKQGRHPNGLAADESLVVAAFRSGTVVRYNYDRVRFKRCRSLVLPDGPVGVALRNGLLFVTFVDSPCIRVYGEAGAVLLQELDVSGIRSGLDRCIPISVGMDDDRLVVGDTGVMPAHLKPGRGVCYSMGTIRDTQRLRVFKFRARPASADAIPTDAEDEEGESSSPV